MLLKDALVKNGHTVGQGHGFDLVVRDIDGGGSKFIVKTADFVAHLMT